MTKVTYQVLEQGDPINTTFAGFKFRAGDPVDIPDDATVEEMNRVVVGKTAEGNDTSKGKEGFRKVIDVLKANPYFVVDGATPSAKAKPGRPAIPKTPSEYRSYAMAWFKSTESSEALGSRWEKESALREKIGIPDEGEDARYLTPFFEQRMHELKMAEKAN